MNNERPLLFFSGGTGPKELARLMAACSIPSVHLISTFDSGRSSKELRRAFAIPALGDLRNRLLALADPDKTSRAVMDFLSFRLPESGNREHLRNCLSDLCNPNNEIWLQIPPHKKIALYNGRFQPLECKSGQSCPGRSLPSIWPKFFFRFKLFFKPDPCERCCHANMR